MVHRVPAALGTSLPSSTPGGGVASGSMRDPFTPLVADLKGPSTSHAPRCPSLEGSISTALGVDARAVDPKRSKHEDTKRRRTGDRNPTRLSSCLLFFVFISIQRVMPCASVRVS